MRRVAGQAAFIGLHRSVFKDERPHGVGVALGADRELTRGSAHLAAGLRPMRIMAVAALDESDIDAVTIRPGKFGLLGGMASIAQCRLWLFQHEVDILGAVRAVAGSAADAIRQVFRLGEVLRLQA